MQQLTLKILNQINQDYDYCFAENMVRKIYDELVDAGNCVSMNDILEEFDYMIN